nr:hypothetical protein [Tanacetum cinerariifolium]
MFLEVLAFGASEVVLGVVFFLAADRFLFFLFESNKVNVGFVNGEAGLDAALSFLTSNVSLISTTPILPLRSSVVGASSHAFHPSSVAKSTLDSSKIPIIPVETYVPDPTYALHRENQTKNNTITENEVEDVAKDTSVSTTCTSEEPEELGNDNSALTTCSVKEERNIEEFQDPPVSTALGNDIVVPATYCNNPNHSSSINGTCSLEL